RPLAYSKDAQRLPMRKHIQMSSAASVRQPKMNGWLPCIDDWLIWLAHPAGMIENKLARLRMRPVGQFISRQGRALIISAVRALPTHPKLIGHARLGAF